MNVKELEQGIMGEKAGLKGNILHHLTTRTHTGERDLLLDQCIRRLYFRIYTHSVFGTEQHFSIMKDIKYHDFLIKVIGKSHHLRFITGQQLLPCAGREANQLAEVRS